MAVRHEDKDEPKSRDTKEEAPPVSGDMGAGVSPEGVPYQGPSRDWGDEKAPEPDPEPEAEPESRSKGK